MSTAGPRGAWTGETTWNWFSTSSGTNGTGGGISPTYAIPSWQQGVSMAGNSGSITYRNVPDVAMTADQICVIANNGTSYDIGGTSAATPLWAGFMALVNQQNEAVSNPPAGFVNPAIYALCEGTNYAACFHDIITGNNTNRSSPGLYYAVSGYDLCAGWGTPIGGNLISVLAAKQDALQVTPLTGFFASATAGGVGKQISQSFLLTNMGTAALDWTLANPAAWLSNSASGGTLPAGGLTNVTFSLVTAIADALPAGTYITNVSFQNMSDGVAQSRRVNLTLVPPQLVQNAGFETGNFTSWALAGSAGTVNFVGNATSLSNGSRRHPVYYGSYYLHSGAYAAFLGQNGDLAYLSQTLPTVAGQTYLLSFWLANPEKLAAPSPDPNEFMVAWNGNTIFDQSNMGIFSYENMQFVVWTPSAGTTLEFGARNDNDYFGLDDVSVTPVPPPVFQSSVSAGGSITLAWSAVAGATYQLQYTTALGAANWSNLGSPVTAVSGAIATSDVQPADPQRFYRVVLAPQP